MTEQILSHLPPDFPWRDTIIWFDSIGSTNDWAKLLAQEGAPHGSVFIANTQTDGRGRRGRSFESPAGMGIYLSVILRPNCPAKDLMHLTCAAAVAACQAVEAATGLQPSIKWTNDLVHEKRKLGGILTELSLNSHSGLVDYAIVGIGINCAQQLQDFPQELQNMAASLSMACNTPVDRNYLAAKLVLSLERMSVSLLTQKNSIMEAYQNACITIGQDICLLRGEEVRYGTALDIDEDGRLLVSFADGATQVINSGEVSVRGMYGYL